MFEIEVFSNPVNALVGEGGLLSRENFPRAARYDEELVKPALLLADRVTLRSHRVDLILNEDRDIENTNRLVPLSSQFLGISKRKDQQELEILGLREGDLMSTEEIGHYDEIARLEMEARDQRRMRPRSTNRAAFLAQRASDRAELGKYNAEWELLLDRAEPFRLALRARLFEAKEAFSSAALAELSSAGILSESPWDSLPKSRPRQVIDLMTGPNAEFERAFNAMVQEVAGSTKSVMLDGEVNSVISNLGPEIGGLESGIVVAGAVELMRMVEGVSELPIDEIAGVRDELRDYIGPFRSFMLEVSGNVNLNGVDEVERVRLLKVAWETDVAPAIAGMEAHVRSTSFRRNAIDVFANSAETMRTVGFALGIAAAAGFVGLSTLTAGAAIVPPIVKILMKSVRANEEVKRDRAYFVHALGSRRR